MVYIFVVSEIILFPEYVSICLLFLSFLSFSVVLLCYCCTSIMRPVLMGTSSICPRRGWTKPS